MATYYVDAAVGNDGNAGTSVGSGNAWATISHALSTIAAGDTVYVKASATYSISSGLNLSVSDFSNLTRIVGYTTSTTDRGRATILASANITGLTISGNGGTFENFIVDANGNTGTGGSTTASFLAGFINCTFIGWSSSGIILNNNANYALGCKVTGTTGGAGITVTNGQAYGCVSISNSVTGISVGNSCVVHRCISAKNSGASSDGISFGGSLNSCIQSCTIYGNGRHGIYSSSYAIQWPIVNNLIVGNTGRGISWPTSSVQLNVNFNAYYNNTAGDYLNIPASYGDVSLSGDPFTNAASDDYSLNNTAGAGAACRGVGFPGAMITGGTGYIDIGALQHQETGGGGTAMLVSGGLVR